ncbi:hypothetical protein EV360DRAFT_85390 [Lentinula raphanica]|nr:hypothetical protein EV360DRAFT_85390 [Lentinula raphanica]
MSYDSSLLASAPQATREMRQEGYNPLILEEEHKSKAIASPIPVVPDQGSAADLTSKEYPPNPNPGEFTTQPKRLPFYRTRKGMIIIAIVAIVIIAAVIGGAVGGTSHKSHALDTVNSSSLSSTTSPSSSNSEGVQGAGTNTAGSGSATATVTTTLTTVVQSATDPGGVIGPVTTTITSTVTEFAAATSTGSANTNGVGNQNEAISSGFVGSRRRLVKRRLEVM